MIQQRCTRAHHSPSGIAPIHLLLCARLPTRPEPNHRKYERHRRLQLHPQHQCGCLHPAIITPVHPPAQCGHHTHPHHPMRGAVQPQNNCLSTNYQHASAQISCALTHNQPPCLSTNPVCLTTLLAVHHTRVPSPLQWTSNSAARPAQGSARPMFS